MTLSELLQLPGAEVFAEPGEHHIIDVVHPATGRSAIEGETLEQLRARYPRAEVVRYDAWKRNRAAEQDAPIVWTATTAEHYEEMLCVLPPAYFAAHGFLVGEPDDHHAESGRARFGAFLAINGEYFAASRPMTIAEFQALTPADVHKAIYSRRVESCQPYKVRMACGHLEDRMMRPATAGIPWSEGAIVDNSGGSECAACRTKGGAL